MRTLSVSISENEFRQFGIKNEKLTFADILDLINRYQLVQHLEKSVSLAEIAGLSEMSMDEIDAEIKAVRDAKNRH